MLALGAAAVSMVAAGPASAAVEINPERIVVETAGAQAVIDRDPFRISFGEPGEAQSVLSQVEGVLGVPGAAGNLDPEPGGFDVIPETGLYAPLAFEVGGERTAQHPGGLWTGNMLIGASAGVVHVPTAVQDAVPDGDGGVDLNVLTTDPGRDFVVNVAPDRPGRIRVRAHVSDPLGVSSTSTSFAAAEGEAFHGFGGRHNSLDQAGTDFYNWVEEEAQGTGPFEPIFVPTPGTGGETYLFPNGPHSAYYVQNIFVSSEPYGFMLNTFDLSRWRMASGRPDAWQTINDGSRIDFTIALGEPEKAISRLTKINGRHRLPPRFAMGPALKRNVQQGGTTPEQQMELITQDIEDIRKHRVNVDMYCFESWATLPPEFVRKSNRTFNKMGIKTCGYLRAYVNDDGNFDPPGTFADAVTRGLVTRTPGGAPFIGVAVGPAALLDFTNPATVAYWREKIFRMLDLGFDAFMNDFGEQVVNEMVFHNGKTGEAMHNEFPNIFHRVTRRSVRAWEKRNPDRGEVFMYTRAGFSGRPGAAAIEGANFPGDENADYSRANGLRAIATDMLNRAVGGAYGYTTDIGGYFDTLSQLDRDLFVRWTQWAALSTFFRLHNSCCSEGTQMPWSFDGFALANWKRMSKLHMRALSYIREEWKAALDGGLPPVRPMWAAFPDEPGAEEPDQQWMVGDDLLVAPVVEKDATSRKVYFPDGCWRHPETGVAYRGAGEQEVPAELDHLPYFFRCTAAKPFNPPPLECARMPGGKAAEVTGTNEGERIRGGGRDQLIRARLGDDCVFGAAGDDRINAGGGVDQVKGGPGDDRIRGGPGGDELNGGPGRDRIRGGAGDDLIKVIRGGRDRVDCGPGFDIVRAKGKGRHRDKVRNCEIVRRR